MGCTPSKADAVQEKADAVQELTWATPTTSLESGRSPQDPPGGQNAEPPVRDTVTPLFQEDAFDDDDEIEIIQEGHRDRTGRSGHHHSGHQGNAQEAPQEIPFPEPVRETITPIPARPLPRQQQEEAAKMAERRQRFENQRYREPAPTASTGRSGSQPVNSGVTPQDGPRAAARADMPHDNPMLGLGLNGRGGARQGAGHPTVEALPGGVEDDVEEVLLEEGRKIGENACRHSSIVSTGFDDDDEELMREILEDCSTDQRQDPAAGWATPVGNPVNAAAEVA